LEVSETALWVDATRIKGPPLARWFIDRGYLDDKTNASLARAIRRWQVQKTVDVYSADTWLTRTDHTLSELPDEIFVAPKRRDRIAVAPTSESTLDLSGGADL
jgi:hypothetical protein